MVTGIGIISAIGRNAGEVLDSLKKARSGMGSITQLDPFTGGELPVAEIRLSNNELAEINQVVDFSLVTRTTLLVLIAAREVARQSLIFGMVSLE